MNGHRHIRFDGVPYHIAETQYGRVDILYAHNRSVILHANIQQHAVVGVGKGDDPVCTREDAVDMRERQYTVWHGMALRPFHCDRLSGVCSAERSPLSLILGYYLQSPRNRYLQNSCVTGYIVPLYSQHRTLRPA